MLECIYTYLCVFDCHGCYKQHAYQVFKHVDKRFDVSLCRGSTHGGHYHVYIRDIEGLACWTPPVRVGHLIYNNRFGVVGESASVYLSLIRLHSIIDFRSI